MPSLPVVFEPAIYLVRVDPAVNAGELHDLMHERPCGIHGSVIATFSDRFSMIDAALMA